MDSDLKPYLNDVFPASTCEDGCKYLRGRLQVLAGKVAYISVEDAVHCEDGCSALRLRWAKLAQKSPVLFWIREKGVMTHLYGSLYSLLGNNC